MMKKTHYYDLSLEKIKEIGKKDDKPRLLLHGCCAPCSCFPLLFLAPYFEITIYYNNSNIYPFAEYEKRRNELVRYLKLLKDNNNIDIPLIEPPYDEGYQNKLALLAQEPEGGKRCTFCYTLRMDEAYNYAHNNGFDYFCTVMTISRQKNSDLLNQIGSELQLKYPNTKYFFSDFKKKDGLAKGREIVKETNMYCQVYCGCVYSYEDSLKINKNDLD